MAGVDEAGRGPWAGPVVAAAVILKKPIEGIKDSKLLTPNKRVVLFDKIQQESLSFGIGLSSVEEIDQTNILQATLLAMQRAVAGLHIRPDEVWVDGNVAPTLAAMKVRTFVKGDLLYQEIGAASILAKVFRDRLMIAYDEEYPEYNFAAHKGYGTLEHRQALEKFGVSLIHRRSFAPIRKLINL